MTSIPILIAILVALVIVAAPASAAKNQSVSFEAPRDLLDPSYRDSTFAELDSLGVKSLRVAMFWKDVAPEPASRVRPSFTGTDPDAYNWSRYEAALDAAKQRGWSVLLTISGPVPRWATNGARNHTYRPSPNEFRQFVTAVSRRFGDRVTTYSIWNEPNHPQFLTPQYDRRKRPVSPETYRGLYAAALRGLQDAGDTKPVLMGETAPHGTGKVVAPLTFLRGALCLDGGYRRTGGCARLRLDGYAHHPYTRRSGPFFKPSSPNDVTIGVLSRLTRALDRAARAGVVARRLPIHLTEFGIQSYPDPLAGVSYIKQAEYRSISERIAWANPRVASFSQYLLRDDTPRENVPRIARYSGFESGLKSASGNPKPALEGFRLPLVAKRGRSGVTLWGLVRPASGAQAVTVEMSDNDGRTWVKLATVATDGAGYWRKGTRYRSGRRWRVIWTAPDGTVFSGPGTRAYR